jgi:hypothetical protein
MADPGLSTFSIVTLVAGSSVLAAIVNQSIGALRDMWKSKREAAFSALYVALALEEYANVCSTLISESETYDSSDGHAGSAHGNIAELPEYPSTVEWKQFGIGSTTKVLSYRVEVHEKRSMIRDMWEFQDEDDVVPVVREEAARLGRKALTLAGELRAGWQIAPAAYTSEWNVKTHLEEKFEKYSNKRRALEEEASKDYNELLRAAGADDQVSE